MKSKLLLTLTLLIYGLNTIAQDGVLNLSFNSPFYQDPPDWNGCYGDEIFAMKILPDGKIMCWGDVDNYQGIPVNNAFRLLPDGRLDETFNAGSGTGTSSTSWFFSYEPNTNLMAVQPDGKILLGGRFTTFNGAAKNRIVRLNSDGSIDTSFNIGTGFDSTVYSITVQPDGKILVGGVFSNYNGTARKCVARLHADGSLDTTFTPAVLNWVLTGGGTVQSPFIQSIEVQSDGKIIIGGFFNRVNGQVKCGISRLNADGTADASFNVGTGTNETGKVRRMQIGADGKVTIAGSITTFNGAPATNLMRLNSNGSVDSSLTLTTNIGTENFSEGIYDFVTFPSGKILVGGDWHMGTLYDMAMVTPTGALDVGFQFENSQALNSPAIRSVGLTPDGNAIAAGYFQNVNGVYNSHGSIVKIFETGFTDLSFNPNFGSIGIFGNIDSALELSDGKILLSTVEQYNERPVVDLIKINPDGTVYDADYGNFRNLNVWGHHMLSHDLSGNVVVSGFVTSKITPSGVVVPEFANTLALVSEWNNYNYANLVQPDGKIIIGGSFYVTALSTRPRIMRVNSNGTLDTSFNVGTGFNGDETAGDNNKAVRAMVLQPDGKIVAGGIFTNYQGTPVNNIAQINPNGSLHSTFGTGFNNEVWKMIDDDGKLVVTGKFTSYNNADAFYIIRLNADGSVDPTFISPFTLGDNYARVGCVTKQPDGKYLISAVTDGTQKLYRLNHNGSIDASFYPDNVFLRIPDTNNQIQYDDLIRSITFLSTGKILVTGAFYKVNGIRRYGFALFNGSTLSNENYPETEQNAAVSIVNPVKELLEIAPENQFESVKIYDLSGKLLKSAGLSENRCSVAGLASGIYIVIAEAGHKRVSMKIIKE